MLPISSFQNAARLWTSLPIELEWKTHKLKMNFVDHFINNNPATMQNMLRPNHKSYQLKTKRLSSTINFARNSLLQKTTPTNQKWKKSPKIQNELC